MHGSKVDRTKASDTGQAMTLICLLIFLFTSVKFWFVAALIVLVVNMACPMIFKPLAFLWFGLAELLGYVVSRVVLTLVFVLLVVPIGLVRCLAGADPLMLKQWKTAPKGAKTGDDSVFTTRNHLYSSNDISVPY